MPMTFTTERVIDRLKRVELTTAGTEVEQRERLAQYTEKVVGDHVEAWEVRTGRGWDKMTREEAKQLVIDKRQTMHNPAVLSRLTQ
jgi:hypothetical protein